MTDCISDRQASPSGNRGGTIIRVQRTTACSMALDPVTLALIAAVIGSLQVLAFVVLARLNPEMRGVGWWAWSSLASAVSMLVLTSRQVLGEEPLVYAAGLAAVTVALACTAVGAAVFVGRPPWFHACGVATLVIMGVNA